MKQIKKKISDSKYGSMASRLASYSAVAACVLTSGGDLIAQCGTATPGAPLPVDIDGDGMPDINLIASNFPGPYSLAMGTVTTGLASFTAPTSFSFTATVTQPGPGTSWNGCITTLTNSVFTAIVPSATAMGPINVTGTINFYNLVLNSIYQYFYSINAGFATGGGNQIVGLTAGGSDVCAAIAGAVATVNLGTCFNISSSYLQYVVGAYSSMLVPMGSVTYDAPPCTTSGGNYYGGLMQTLSFLPATFTNPGPYLVSGPNYYGPNFVSQSCLPGSTFLGVEFAGGDGTQYGWVEVVYNPDGSITCVDSGYNGCSVEEVAASAAAGGNGVVGTSECIAVGAASVNTDAAPNPGAACTLPVCTLADAGLVVGACDDAGTGADATDDTFTFDLNPAGTDLGASGYTFTDAGGTYTGTGAYGAAATFGPFPISGGTQTITITDVDNPACTIDVEIAPPVTCSTDVCTLTDAGLVVGACDDAGTGADATDDTFTLDLNPTGTTLGASGYTFTDAGGTYTGTGAYGAAATFGPFPISGGAQTITITDVDNPACTIDILVTPPATCSADVCIMSATASNIMCDPGATPDDGADDMVTFDITVMDTGGGGTTWSDDMGNTGQSYGTAVSYGPFLAGGSQTVVITDDSDPACTQTVTVSLNDCAVVENIPTVGEWGLIILGLMMSITAIVGIRQRREEEVAA